MKKELLAATAAILFVVPASLVRSDESSVVVELHADEAPKLRAWGEDARKTLLEWYPRICNLLPTKGFVAPSKVHLRIRKSDKGVAGTAGNKIGVMSHWIEEHPEDVGVVVHEVVHVIQAYPDANPGWVTEGIADYIRWAIYDGKPQSWFPVGEKFDGYKAGYRVSAGFLLWLETDAAPGIVKKLNTHMRLGTYDESVFERESEMTLEELWQSYVKARTK